MASRTRNAHTKITKERKEKRGKDSARTLQNVPSDAQSKEKVWRVAKLKLEAERTLINKCNAVLRTEACQDAK